MKNDNISRQAAIAVADYTDCTGVAIEDVKKVTDEVVKELKQLPSAQPDLQEYSVWFRIGETLVDVSKMHITAEEGIQKIRSYLMRMKKPERKTGRWVPGREIGKEILTDETIAVVYEDYKCSSCGLILYRLLYNADGTPFYKFCPNCGADMRGE